MKSLRFISTLIFILSCSSNLHSQDSDVYEAAMSFYKKAQFDSCIHVLQKSLNANDYISINDKIKTLNFIAKCYRRNRESDKAIEMLRKSLKLNGGDFTDLYMESILEISDVYTANFDYDSTKYYLDKVSLYFDNDYKSQFSKHRARYLFNLGSSLLDSDTEKAINLLYQALEIFNPQDEQKITLYLLLADIQSEDLNKQEALRLIREAENHFKTYFKADISLESEIQYQLGYYYHAIGQFDFAISIYKRANQVISSNTSRWARYIKSEGIRLIAYTYGYLGDYHMQLKYSNYNLFEKKKLLGDSHYRVGEALLWIGRAYSKLDMPEKALGYLDEAIRIFKHNHDIGYQSICLRLKGVIHLYNENYEESIKSFNLMMEKIIKIDGDTLLMLLGQTALAKTFILSGHLSDADSLIRKVIEKRLETFPEDLELVRCYNLQGRIFEKLGDINSAENCFVKSINVLKRLEVSKNTILLRTYNLYAELLLKMNKIDEAYNQIKMGLNEIGIELISEDFTDLQGEVSNNGGELLWSLRLMFKYFNSCYRENLDSEDLIRAMNIFDILTKKLDYNKERYLYDVNDIISRERRNYEIYEDAIITCLELYTKINDEKWQLKAYEIASKGKSAVLSEKWNYNLLQLDIIPDSLIIQESSLQRQLIFLKSKVNNLSKNSQNKAQLEQFRKKEFQVRVRHDQLMRKLEQDYADYYNVKYRSQEYSIKNLQDHLQKNEILIEYYEGEKEIYGFVISRDAYKVYELAKPEGVTLEKFRRDFELSSHNKDIKILYTQYVDQGYNLYLKLLKPIINDFSGRGVESIKIIPDGKLNLVPFDLLLTKLPPLGLNYKDLPYLFKQYNISHDYSSMAPLMTGKSKSASNEKEIIALAPSEFDSPALALANQTSNVRSDDLRPLKWNINEVKAIESYFESEIALGNAATESLFKDNIKDYNIAHLSMHALIDNEDPMYSKLLFAPPKDTLEDGMLHAFELYGMQIDAQMVVLSACNTGAGKLQKGEGVMSLARAFAYAGCPSVVMSHWAVDDKSTSELMNYFYKHLAKGERKDEALRNAKLDFLENSNVYNQHPYFWNSFVVMGDTSPIVQLSSFEWWWLGVCLMIVSIILLGIRKYLSLRV